MRKNVINTIIKDNLMKIKIKNTKNKPKNLNKRII